MEKEYLKKSLEGARKHFDNIEKLQSGEETDYSYLNYCWACGKKFTILDRLLFNMVHSFSGNAHRRNCIK